MDSRRIAFVTSVAIAGIVFWCLWLWQPERQIRLHQRSLLRAAEKRDWTRMGELMADSYSDRWGHDKANAIERAKQVFGQFLLVDFRVDPPGAETVTDDGKWSGRLLLEGRGGPLGEMAIQRLAELRDPFVFSWQQRSWKPWDWQLTGVEQPELEVPRF